MLLCVLLNLLFCGWVDFLWVCCICVFWVWWALLWFMLKLVFAFDLVICLCYVVNSVVLADSFVGDLLVIACW